MLLRPPFEDRVKAVRYSLSDASAGFGAKPNS
jgi:hypothetical protein